MMPPELVEAFARGGGVIFVGAGLSMAAGYPDWHSLMEPLRAELGELPSNASYPDVAEWYELRFGRALLMQRLKRELIRATARPTSAHKAMLQLPLQRIYTSNFDSLIEQTASELSKRIDVVVDSPDLAVLEADMLHLIKIHGDLGQPASVTITADDYELFSTRKPPLSNLLKTDLLTRVVLFVGYSFSDENLRLILAQARHEGGATPRNRYALAIDPSAELEAMLRFKGMTPVVLSTDSSGDKSAAVAHWMEQFSECVAQQQQPHRSVSPPPVQRSHNLPAAPTEFVGRDAEITKVMTGLASRYPLVAIEGFAGVGKTSLAIRVGHACALGGGKKPAGTILFDYIVWVSAKDKPDQAEWLDDVLNAIANTTGYLAISQLPAAEANKKRNQVELLLQTFRILLIIDNLETIQDEPLINWLEALPAPSKVLVTTRNSQLQQKAYAVHLGGLSMEHAIDLLETQVGQLKVFPEPDSARLQDLAEVTGRNPQAMRLALGLVSGGLSIDDVVNGLEGTSTIQSVEPLFTGIFESSWKIMSVGARTLLLTTPLFVGVESIRRDAMVATAGLADRPFDARRAVEECVRLGLLETVEASVRHEDEQRFHVHPMTRSFARSRWQVAPLFEEAARNRLLAYFLLMVRGSVIRAEPPISYWNALVSDGMLQVDPEWPSILELMRWCDENGRDEELFNFTMALVHYMDSRFFNNDRLHFVGRCVEIAHATGRAYEESLLRIDALGWTYGEERRFSEAISEIRNGMKIAGSLNENTDLMALGYAWLARVEIEQENVADAEALIAKALALKSSPWIACRVLMAKGDIELKSGRGAEALSSYKHAAAASVSYGDEGRGYQTKPRIGLAHLATRAYDEAKEVFGQLKRFEHMEIAELYGEYGLAMVAYENGETKGAGALVDALRERLLRRTSSNLLLNMTQKLQADLESSRPER